MARDNNETHELHENITTENSEYTEKCSTIRQSHSVWSVGNGNEARIGNRCIGYILKAVTRNRKPKRAS